MRPCVAHYLYPHAEHLKNEHSGLPNRKLNAKLDTKHSFLPLKTVARNMATKKERIRLLSACKLRAAQQKAAPAKNRHDKIRLIGIFNVLLAMKTSVITAH